MQNRQREEFAELLSDIYPDLQTNHDRVKDNKPPPCLEKSVFFWHHDSEETKERSVTNEEEAIRAVNLALFLVQQGYTPNRITILATYRGQRNLIRTKMKAAVTRYNNFLPEQVRHFLQPKDEDGFDDKGNRKVVAEDTTVKINTVDMYQGDENDVVIVSLVRSNKRSDIGFLKEMNRRCVAQSRARCGLYFIGDVKMFRDHKTWRALIAKLKKKKCVSEEIGLICRDHPQSPYKVKDGNGMCLQKLINFCEQPCGQDMSCGEHLCPEKCQVIHLHSHCKARVAFKHQICEHGDTKFCHEEVRFKKCRVSIKFNFQKCGHQATRECWQSELSVPCLLKHFVELSCGHPISKKCHEDVQRIKCEESCNQKREGCGHVCRGDHKCFEHAKYECKDCKEYQRELRKQRRREEEKQREENEKRVQEEIEKLKKDKEALGKVWYNEIKEEAIATRHDIGERIKQYVTTESFCYPEITKIEEVFNPGLDIRFKERSLKLLKTSSSIKMFYTATEDEIRTITKDGISLSKEEIAEITEKKISLPSSGTICLNSHWTTRGTDTEEEKKLILCEVFLGKVKNVKDLTEANMTKCDSIVVPRKDDNGHDEGKKYHKFILFKADQLFPRYVVSYRLKPLPEVRFKGPFNSCKKVILPQRHINSNDLLQTHFSFVESRFLRMINRMEVNCEITKIEFYTNPKLEGNFQKQCEEFKKKYCKSEETDPIFGFHGTKSDEVVESIMNNNFKPSTSGKFGAGVYFSEQPNYTFGYGGRKHLILAKILPGKVYECFSSSMGSSKCTEGYDSHGGFKKQEGTFDEIVIFNTNQILPMYVIHFK